MAELNQAKAEKAAEEFARNLEKYPEGIQYAVSLTLPNLLNGCSWGFIPVDDAERDILEAMRNEPSVGVVPLKNGFLVEMDFDYATRLAQQVSMGIYTHADLTRAAECREKAIQAIVKFMQKLKEGVTRIGIYNLNDSPNITVNGVVMPAFNVNMMLVCNVMEANDLSFKVGNARVTAGQAAGNMERFFREGCELAPSGNSLLVDIVK